MPETKEQTMPRSWCPYCDKPLSGGKHFPGRCCGTCHTETILDLSRCPRCGDRTQLTPVSYATYGLGQPKPVHSWWCECCEGWWQQVGRRDPVWVHQWQPATKAEEG